MLYAANYAALRVFLVMVAILPVRSGRDAERRYAIAEAIVRATDDLREQEVLAKIGRFESGFADDVASCKRLGDRGRAFGLFQLHPIETGHKAKACGSYEEQAALALSYVKRSAEACPGNVGADRLAMFVSGTCARGLREARHRWAE